MVELLLRRMAASGSRIRMVWRGLAGSELAAPIGGVFMGSSVSRTTSGACLAVFCLSSSRSSFSAVLMVFSMSCKRHQQRDVSTMPQHHPALLHSTPWRGPLPWHVCLWRGGASDLRQEPPGKAGAFGEDIKPKLWPRNGTARLPSQQEFGHQLQREQTPSTRNNVVNTSLSARPTRQDISTLPCSTKAGFSPKKEAL